MEKQSKTGCLPYLLTIGMLNVEPDNIIGNIVGVKT